MRRLRRFGTTLREWKLVAKALLSTDHPVLAHLIPIRRCNLTCAYCNEYDASSPPVSTDIMHDRVDMLADLGTSAITISGGEPLLHPRLESIIVRMRKRNVIASMITNGYLLSRERIQQLNDAGLEHLQISIDNVEPDNVSKKSLKVLDKKLLYLAELADFKVNINSVLGSGVRDPEDALAIGRRAVELGFTCTVGISHDGKGRLRPLGGREAEVFEELKSIGKRGYARVNRYFQENLASGKPNHWACRAGARYLYICEDGLVHYCSQQRGYPGIPLEDYSIGDIRREYRTQKGCAPFCTVSCVHQASMPDFWRAPQEYRVPHRRPAGYGGLVQLE